MISLIILLGALPTDGSKTQRFHSTTILIISVIVTFVLTVIITSILTILITIIITYCIKYSRSDENTDILPPAPIEVEDPTTTNNPSYQPTILRTEV